MEKTFSVKNDRIFSSLQKLISFTVCFFITVQSSAYASNIPADQNSVAIPASSPASVSFQSFLRNLKPRDIEKMTGRRMSFGEKIKFKFLKTVLLHSRKQNFLHADSTTDGKVTKGDLAKIFGITSLVGIIVPYAQFLSLPAAILAIIFGIKARKLDKNDKDAKAGIIMGSITLGLFVLAAIALLILFSGFFFG